MAAIAPPSDGLLAKSSARVIWVQPATRLVSRQLGRSASLFRRIADRVADKDVQDSYEEKGPQIVATTAACWAMRHVFMT